MIRCSWGHSGAGGLGCGGMPRGGASIGEGTLGYIVLFIMPSVSFSSPLLHQGTGGNRNMLSNFLIFLSAFWLSK